MELTELNQHYKAFTIKINSKLKIDRNLDEHHLIPKGFELIPNITIFWTIQYLKHYKPNVIGVNIEGKTLIINKTKLLMIDRTNHNELHMFLEYQRKALYLLHGQVDILKNSYEISKEFKQFYANRNKTKKKNDIITINKDDFVMSKMTKNPDSIKNPIKTITKAQKKKSKKQLKEQLKNEYARKSLEILNNVNNYKFYKNFELTKFMKEYLNYDYSSDEIILGKINGLIALVRKKYLTESAVIKTIASNDIFYNKINDDVIKDIINVNNKLIAKIKGKDNDNVNYIFSLGLLQSIRRTIIVLDEKNKIISGIEFLKYLINNNISNTDITFLKLNDNNKKNILKYLKSK